MSTLKCRQYIILLIFLMFLMVGSSILAFLTSVRSEFQHWVILYLYVCLYFIYIYIHLKFFSYLCWNTVSYKTWLSKYLKISIAEHLSETLQKLLCLLINLFSLIISILKNLLWVHKFCDFSDTISPWIFWCLFLRGGGSMLEFICLFNNIARTHVQNNSHALFKIHLLTTDDSWTWQFWRCLFVKISQ